MVTHMNGYSFLEFMKRIGIFLVCAQSIMHFTAGKSYEKYIKLLIGVMVLGQFIIPVRALFAGSENAEIGEMVERFQKEMETALNRTDIVYEDREMADAYEEEIKDRLEGIALKYNYTIAEALINKEPPGILITVVPSNTEKNNIKIDKIVIDIDSGEAGKKRKGERQETEGEAQAPEGMATEFAVCLGTDEAYIDITVK